MNEIQNELQQLSVSPFQAGEVTPWEQQEQYPAGPFPVDPNAADPARLCVGFGGAGLCGGFGGAGFCGGFCAGSCSGFCGGFCAVRCGALCHARCSGFCGAFCHARCSGFCGARCR